MPPKNGLDERLVSATDVENQSGSSPEVTLEFANIRYVIGSGTKKEKPILRGVSGKAPPRTLLAILGPSGSGKTSLLNVLACRVPLSKKSSLTGTVLVNSTHPHTPVIPRVSGFVEQETALFENSTVVEVLSFCARLRMPKATAAMRADSVSRVMAELGLTHCATSIVGGLRTRGISGGERKRLTIGIELLCDPSVVFADEPTSGLDSFHAYRVMCTLRDLSRRGRTVIVSIHQPRSSIYQLFDNVLLLSSGSVAYSGEAGSALEQHFRAAGHEIPAAFNPADHLLDVVSVDPQEKESASRVEGLLAYWASHGGQPSLAEAVGRVADGVNATTTAGGLPLSMQQAAAAADGASCSRFFVAFGLLTRRTFRELTRNKIVLVIKYVIGIFMSIIFGLVYFRMDTSQKSIQNRTGILFFVAMNQAFSSTIDTAQQLPRQLVVVSRERASRMYPISAFYLANFVCTVPLEFFPQLINASIVYFMTGLRPTLEHFAMYVGVLVLECHCAIALGLLISASINSVNAAPKIAPLCVVLLLIFSGYLLNDDSIPVGFVFLKYPSFIRYAFQGLLVNEFKDAKFTGCTVDPSTKAILPPGCIMNGNLVLDRLSFGSVTVIGACINLGIILASFHALALLILACKRPRFLEIKSS